MTQSSRAFDLVVLGATAFTGKVAAKYLAAKSPTSFRWAIAGRNADRLKSLFESLAGSAHPPASFHVVDHADASAVDALVSQARVALTFAGPFGRYGEPIIAACAQHGTHYLDITGETVWVSRMIEKYQAVAQQSGAILIPFAGFDSVPSDIGVWKVLEAAHQTSPGKPISKVVSLFTVQGGVNGGTFQTALDMLEQTDEDRHRFRDSALLVPQEQKAAFRFSDSKWPVRVQSRVAPPFFMAPINSRVVYRSQAIRSARTGSAPVHYVELLNVGRALNRPKAWGIAGASKAFEILGSLPGATKLLEPLGPKAGEGPSESDQKDGYFRADFYAYSEESLVAKFSLSCAGDPGNRATTLMACESALCLILTPNELPESSGGFWTASTALGEPLLKRLNAAGLRSGTPDQLA